jgi:hypothetical protein
VTFCRKKTKRKVTLVLEHKILCGNEVVILSADNREKRSGLNRRQYSYDKHIPERRSDQDRRSKLDRRLKPRKSE